MAQWVNMDTSLIDTSNIFCRNVSESLEGLPTNQRAELNVSVHFSVVTLICIM